MAFHGNNGNWFAVQVKPKHEFAAAVSLRSKGYEEFLPTYQSRQRWSDRWKQVEIPLFAGYVFCRMDNAVLWPIITTPGVIRIVGTHKRVAIIEDREIEAIRIVVKAGMKAEPCQYVDIGDRVRIEKGPLAGVEGIVTAYRNQQRFVISVDLIQRSICVDADSFVAILENEQCKTWLKEEDKTA